MSQRFSSPIAQVDPRFERWRKIRVPLFGGIALIILVVSGLLIRSCVVARNIRNELARAAELSADDTIEGHREALTVLEGLRGDNPGHDAIRTRFAWQHVLIALRLGPVEEHVQAAQSALGAEGEGAQTALLAATRAGLLLAEGNAEGAEQLARATAEQAPACRECAFVHGLSLARLGRAEEAVPILDQARHGRQPFLPALAALSEVLRDIGRIPDAHNALKLLAQAASTHRGAKVQSVLIELDKVAGDPAASAKAVGPLKAHLSAVELEDSYPERAAYKHYAQGRLALIEGNAETAAAELAAAAKVLPRDQALAMWRGRALRRAGRHADAVEALSPFPDAPTTSLALIEVRADVLLDMHRVADAAAPIAVLTQKGVKGASLLEGRRLFYSGEPRTASKLLEKARAEGQGDALPLIMEALALRGRMDLARNIFRELPDSGAAVACGKGLYSYNRGSTKRARQRWTEAAKGGGRCGQALAGRFLIGTGGAEDRLAGLEKALAVREDARDRVALGRLLLRVKGAAAAREQLDAVRAMEPQGALVLRDLVDGYVEMGLREVAVEVARQGITRTKGHPLLAAAASRLAREADELDEADRIVADGLKARPRNAALLFEKAAILVERRRYPDAEEAINEALRPGPGFAEAACLRAEILEKRGNRRDAQISLNRAAARAPTKSGVVQAAGTRACLVRHFIRRGRPSFGKARGNIFLLRRTGIIWAEIPFLAGYLAERDGEQETAADQYRRALRLDPAHEQAWERLSRLGALTDEDRQLLERTFPGRGSSSR